MVYITHGMCNTPENRAWGDMKQRCHNKDNKRYHRYGGRGIKVCKRWRKSFENFIKDMGLRPSPKHSLERIDNNKGYLPSNCTWATREDQYRNRAPTKLITYNGKTLSTAEWGRTVGLSKECMYYRIKAGWGIGRILDTPSERA